MSRIRRCCTRTATGGATCVRHGSHAAAQRRRSSAPPWPPLLLLVLVACLWPVSAAHAQTVSGVACSPTVIAGGSGASATCTVTLGAAAPTGGTVVALTSSLIELAASQPTVTVPAGATSATFTVATNPRYRPYSQLAFTAAIAASANGTTGRASLTVTAQTPPADFSSGSQAGANTQWSGLMCGGIAPIGGSPDVLYDCSPASATAFGTCTFRQECSLGCRRVPPNGGVFNDFCATSAPNPVELTRNLVVGGDRVPATMRAEAPAGNAPARDTAVPRVIDPNANSTSFPQNQVLFPIGATTVGFDVATSRVPATQFVEVGGYWFNDAIPPFLITNARGGHAWLVMLPTDPPPATAIPTLGNFTITGNNPVTGGQQTIGQIDLSGVSRAGGPTFTITSTHPDIVPTMTVNAPVSSSLFGFQAFINTNPPSIDTDVTLTATDGRYTFTGILRVLAPPPPAVLSSVSVTPSSVVGGNPSTGTVSLSAPQGGATVVTLSTPAPASVATMPATVTVPAGATSASFVISTSPVASTFNMNIFADLAGSPGRQALLVITANASPGVSAVSVSPGTVQGGASSTGLVALTTAAPAGGALVSLTSSNAAASVAANVTVPAGATSATFPIATTAVTASTVATVTAVFNNTSRSADLTITAPAGAGAGAPGFLNPAANAADSGGDGNGFEVNPVNAHLADGAVAADIDSGTGTGTTCTSSGKDRHRFYDYGIAVPAGSSITGIEVRLDARADDTAGAPKMCVQLSWDGGITWTAAKATATLGTAVGTFVLGGPADTWGRTWTAADVANANFRVRVINVSSSTARDFFLDWIGVRVGTGTPPPAAADTVTIQRVEYDSAHQDLRIDATSTSANATLDVFVTSTNALIGTLTNTGGGSYSRTFSGMTTNPQNVTIRSSLGGSASRTVTAK